MFAELIQDLRQAWRMTWRDWRAGELSLLVCALVLAVAALTSVAFLSDRMRGALERDARQLLGADLVIVADAPIADEFVAQAVTRGLSVARTAAFPSMAVAGTRSRLAAVKAVTSAYPLRGRLRLALPEAVVQSGVAGKPAGGNLPDVPAQGVPSRDGAWLDPELLDGLGLQLGHRLQLGKVSLRVDGVLTQELDRGAAFMNFAPRLMVNWDALAASGLDTVGSRIGWRLLVAGDEQAVRAYHEWAKDRIDAAGLRGIRIESLENAQPQMRSTLDRAARFLSLVVLLSVLVSAVAIAMAARRFVHRHLDACAVSKVLGQTHGRQLRMFAGEFLTVGLSASAAGTLCGFAVHDVLLWAFGDLWLTDLPAASAWPWFAGLASGLVLVAGFALPPLLALVHVAPLRVLRRELGAPPVAVWLAYGLGALALAALLLWAAQDMRVAALTGAGFAVALAVFALLAWTALQGSARLWAWRGAASGFSARMVRLSMRRRGGLAVLQIVALALGLMALLLLGITRHDLLKSWRSASPPDGPNRFIVNIQPEQRADLERLLTQAGVERPVLYPMVRGRLIAINDRPVRVDDYRDEGARRLIDREFNLSYTTELPKGNRIVGGAWYGRQPQPALSLEQGLAKTLGLKLGDRLRFDVAGEEIEAPLTSLRKLDWGTMRVNFFVTMPPALLQDFPQTWITAFRQPAAASALEGELLTRFPNLTVVNTDWMIAQVQRVLDRVIRVVEILFLFALLAGAMVLFAALSAGRDERMRDAALLRALGASSAQLWTMQTVELLWIGALSGSLAALGALASGWALAVYAFEFEYLPNWLIVPSGLVAGMLVALLSGWLGLRGVIARPALLALREAV